MASVNQTNYQRFIIILHSAGFIHAKLLTSKTSINFSYALYLKLRKDGMHESECQHYVKRWLWLTYLTGRYSGSAESFIDEDIKQIDSKGIGTYLMQIEQANLGDGFWQFRLVNDLETSSTNNNAYILYLAAQCLNKSPAFLSKSMAKIKVISP